MGNFPLGIRMARIGRWDTTDSFNVNPRALGRVTHLANLAQESMKFPFPPPFELIER